MVEDDDHARRTWFAYYWKPRVLLFCVQPARTRHFGGATSNLELDHSGYSIAGNRRLGISPRIRESNMLAHVPVVVIGGVAQTTNTLTRGAATVLQKPISRAQLKASLAKIGLHATAEQTHTVLVVDEDPSAAEVIAKFFRPRTTR